MRIASRLAPRLARPLSMSALTVAPTNLGKSVVTKSEPMQDGRWIGLRRLDWTDQEGRQRAWEMAERKTTGSGGVDAVAIVGVLNQPGKERSIPIILQYRPPVQAICVELPAGLIDGDELAETAAVRELEEETGYKGGKVVDVGEIVVSDPGMSKASMRLVTIEVEVGADAPVPKLEDGEFIEVRVTPLKSLYAHLQAYDKVGYVIDARLYHLAAGIELAKKYSLH